MSSAEEELEEVGDGLAVNKSALDIFLSKEYCLVNFRQDSIPPRLRRWGCVQAPAEEERLGREAVTETRRTKVRKIVRALLKDISYGGCRAVVEHEI